MNRNTQRKLAKEGGAPLDYKVKASATDTVFGFLLSKLVAGLGITLTQKNIGGDEDIEIKSSIWNVSGNNINNLNSGNVGIGTVSPNSKLEVAGTLHVSGALNSVVMDKLSGTGSRIVMTDASGSLYATSSSVATGLPAATTAGQTLRADGTNWVANSVLYNNGTNVGIGTTNPLSLLNVQGTNLPGLLTLSNSQPTVLAGDTMGQIDFYTNDASGITNRVTASIKSIADADYVGTQAQTSLAFFTQAGGGVVATERLRINNVGNVGIGITTPTAKLDIASDIIRVRTPKTPLTSGSSGNQGDIAWDADYIYTCVATNTWKRSALTTW